MGRSAFKVYQQLKVDADTFETVTKKIKEHLTPHTISEVEIAAFNKMHQHPSETIDAYVMRLREKAVNCKFDALNKELVQALLNRTNSIAYQKALLALDDRSLDNALKLARRMEMVERERPDHPPLNDINRIGTSRSAQPNISCGKCGRMHPSNNCPAYGLTCRQCGGNNHFAAMCRSKRVDQNAKPYQNNRQHNDYSTLSRNNNNNNSRNNYNNTGSSNYSSAQYNNNNHNNNANNVYI
jgi:hypothetical protein